MKRDFSLNKPLHHRAFLNRKQKRVVVSKHCRQEARHMHSSQWRWVVQLPSDVFSFAFVRVAGVCRWQGTRRSLVTRARGQPRRCRDWKGSLIASSIGTPRMVRMSRERLWKMRASGALSSLSSGTKQVSVGRGLFLLQVFALWFTL